MIAMVSPGRAEPCRRPLDLQAREPRPARVGAPHDEDRRGARGRRQPAGLEALSPPAAGGGGGVPRPPPPEGRTAEWKDPSGLAWGACAMACASSQANGASSAADAPGGTKQWMRAPLGGS